MFDMLGKMGQMKKAMEEVKSRLDHITVIGEAGEGQIRVTMTGNMKVKAVEIHERLMDPARKEELEELTELAINRAIDQSRSIMETEMRAASQGMFPGFPGLS
ncbi:MAG: YbaB/EbfC family nucleoid-associated protein [Bacteroidota bacterium]